MADEVVTFDPTAWKQAFPAFATLPDPVATGYFNLATLYLNNSPCSIVQDIPVRTMLLGLATAHLAQLFGGPTGSGQPGIVGRISSATEGSVSVSAEMLAESESAAWWDQTPYGAAWWAATVRFRSARYIAAPPYVFDRIPWSRPGYLSRRW